MAYEVQISRKAKAKIKNTLSYIAKELGSPLAMESLANSIERTFNALSISPNAYPIDKKISRRANATVRKINIKNYWFLYTVDEEKEEVDIVSFLHSRQSKSRFFEDYYSCQ